MANDDLTLTVRLYDPTEKTNPALAASWATLDIPRADLQLSKADFVAKNIIPALEQLKNLTLS